METIWPIAFIIVAGFFIVQSLLVFIFCHRNKNNERPELPRINKISIVIPVHNEADRIQDLLESINKQEDWSDNFELIFVNDFSDDKTIEIIESTLKKPCQIIHLDKKKGKKQALHEGIQKAKYNFILTLDGDVKPSDNYFNFLFKLPQVDMIILPVNMVSETIFQELTSIEFSWLQLLTFGSKKPILCSGANLIFKKSAYETSLKMRSDFGIASGDDVFLLQAFLASQKTVDRFLNDDLLVETNAPYGFMNLLRQRKRWLSKFSKMADVKNTKLVLFLLLLQFALIFSLIAIPFYPYFLILIVLKVLTEYYAAVNQRGDGFAYISRLMFVHQIWYPIYLLLLCLPFKADVKWKHLEMETVDPRANDLA